jgi:hypothetical protein
MMYTLIHFLHIIGSLGIAAAYAIEAASLTGLRRSTNGTDARAWLAMRRWVLILGPASIALVLVTGIYASAAHWGLSGWIIAALGGVVGLAAIGGVLTGLPMARLKSGISGATGPLTDALRREIRGQALLISLTTRITLTIGIVSLMVWKPALAVSLIVIAVTLVIGVATAGVIGAR